MSHKQHWKGCEWMNVKLEDKLADAANRVEDKLKRNVIKLNWWKK